MSETIRAYAPHFVARLLSCCKPGGSPEELARATAERQELNRLQRENRQLRLERKFSQKAAAWFARETNAIPPKGKPNSRLSTKPVQSIMGSQHFVE